MKSCFDIELELPPPPEARLPLPLSGELGLFDIEARRTGLVNPMLILPPPLPPEDTVMVTGEEEGDDAVFTIVMIFLLAIASPEKGRAGGRYWVLNRTSADVSDKKKKTSEGHD